MPLRAAIYCRLSQDRTGAGVVVERQERDCRELAAQLGWTVERVFVDNDVSAYRRRPRPGYAALMETLESGELDGVLAWHTDRLHRSPKELETYIDVCEPRGVLTRTVRAGELDLGTASGRMVARQLGAVARYESEQTAGRTRAGKADAAGRGAFQGGQRMYGYRVIPAHLRDPAGAALDVVPEERDVVQQVAARILAGESLRAVARSLNEEGKTTTQGKPWTGSAMRKVLLRPTTAGLRAVGREATVRGQWPALIDEDQWRGLKALLTDPARRTTEKYSRTYLGSGLYLCGVCGGPLTGNTTAGGGGVSRKAAYRCRIADRDGQSHVVRGVAALDDFVQRLVIGRLGAADAQPVRAAPSLDQTALLEEAAVLRARLDEAARGWAAGALTQSQLLAATAELKGLLAAVEARLATGARSGALAGLAGTSDLEARWQSLTLSRRRAVVEALMQVTVLPRTRRGRLPGGAYFDPACVDVTWL
jgi:site-specific DNA recombinase